MATPTLFRTVSKPGIDLDRLAKRIVGRPAQLEDALAGLERQEPKIKYGCAKLLQRMAEIAPELLYQEFPRFTGMLAHENQFLRCHAIRILAQLSRVDDRRRFEEVFDRFFAPIAGPALIPAVHAIESGATVAVAKPKLTERTITAILRVRRARYRTTECRHIACGKAVESLGRFFEQADDRDRVLRFVRGQLRSSRPATRKKAARFLKHFSGR